MSENAFPTTKTKASENFERSDWSSAYSNVDKEFSNFELKAAKGAIPKDLFGTLYRNGPGRLERNGQWVHHPFDGDGMITSLRFEEGKANLTNRFVRTKAWQEEEKAGKFIYRGVFGTQKAGGALSNAFDLRLKNIANTNVVLLGNELLALWEAASPYSLDPRSLDTHGISNLNGVLNPGEAFSAHPRFDPGHNNQSRMVTFGVNTGPKSTIRLMEFSTQGDDAGVLISNRKDTFNGFAFLHDFAITPNWAVFLQNAIDFNPLPFIFGQKGAAQCLSSSKNNKGRFLLIPRDSGCYALEPPRIFEAPDGFVFHHLNAWEENSEVVIESIFYNDFPSIQPNENFLEINFDEIPEGILKKCRINLLNKNVTTEVLSNQCCEFAMVNPRMLGMKARYSWMATAQKEHGNGPLQNIKKFDLFNSQKHIWSAAPRGFVSEPIMVPTSSSNEDDGWVLTVVWNGERLASDLVILNANDLSEQAILELPLAIPHGLHGSWVEG
ncbi:carotenoid oxygenase family protein [Prochlorococcus marinus]|uniref:Retinal pigment epithelial membrane protein n=1 Tax=Prochlorococcus marinus (strain MIT 9211) TaxID=93059 RepID=A9BDS8_PROM4|nr:carotenoid oxygenase family protein [Prochlorococcus marinus]ABX08238.1 Retinal pigment epithelial membrane protein [Prochlorococcus marinus str. MIT 9211]